MHIFETAVCFSISESMLDIFLCFRNL